MGRGLASHPATAILILNERIVIYTDHDRPASQAEHLSVINVYIQATTPHSIAPSNAPELQIVREYGNGVSVQYCFDLQET